MMNVRRFVLGGLLAGALSSLGVLGAPWAAASDARVTAGTSTAIPASEAPPVPEDSGMGRRIVYDMGSPMRVWLIDDDESVVRTYPVSGHSGRALPGTGTFWIYSVDRWNFVKNNPGTKLDFMMRFARGTDGESIGFHAIPRTSGGYIQSESTLGVPTSHGCVRQAPANAEFLWDWARIGTVVVVVDSSGKVPAAAAWRRPSGTPPPSVRNPWAARLPLLADDVWPVPAEPMSDRTLFRV